MAGIPHEEYLNRLFKAKAEQKRRDAALPPEKKLETWLRLQKMVREIQAGMNQDDKSGI